MHWSRMSTVERTSLLLSIVLLGVAAMAGAQEPAPAPPAAPQSGPVFNIGLSAGFSTMSISNSHFGRGLIWPLPTPEIPLDTYKRDVARTESYIAPRVNMEWNLGGKGTLHGGLRAVASRTVGDGDTWNLTAGNPSRVDLDTMYLGWRSPATNRIKWEASFGNQDFQLADGMVLVDGDNEAGKKGVYWLDPRHAWNNAAIVKVDAAPVRFELFSLNSDGDAYTDGQGTVLGGNLGDSIQGGNLEFGNPTKMGIVGASYFHISDSDLPSRRGMGVTAIHGRGRPIRTLPTLEFGGEYNSQKNAHVDANAWFGEATYTLLRPWYPTIGYRYSSFSGDNASTTDTNEAWDSLHNGFTPRGFGYWYHGLVIGTYETLLSNLDVNFVHLTVAPPMVPGSWLKALFYEHKFNDKSTAGLFPVSGTPVSSDRFATEWDFIVGFSPSKKYDIMAIYAQAFPEKGGRERNQGFGESESLIQFTVLFHY